MAMDLILWRHAEAEDLDETDEGGGDDLSRRLTPRGEKQAARMAAWLDRQLPEGTRIWSSPAVRTEQTVLALGRRYRVRPELGPGWARQYPQSAWLLQEEAEAWSRTPWRLVVDLG